MTSTDRNQLRTEVEPYIARVTSKHFWRDRPRGIYREAWELRRKLNAKYGYAHVAAEVSHQLEQYHARNIQSR